MGKDMRNAIIFNHESMNGPRLRWQATVEDMFRKGEMSGKEGIVDAARTAVEAAAMGPLKPECDIRDRLIIVIHVIIDMGFHKFEFKRRDHIDGYLSAATRLLEDATKLVERDAMSVEDIIKVSEVWTGCMAFDEFTTAWVYLHELVKRSNSFNNVAIKNIIFETAVDVMGDMVRGSRWKAAAFASALRAFSKWYADDKHLAGVVAHMYLKFTERFPQT